MSKANYSVEEGRTQMAAVITDLDGKVLFTNRPAKTNWYISGIKTYKTRFWSSGKATVVLTTDVDGIEELTPDFPSDIFGTETQFCIYLGWLNGLVPFGIQDHFNNFSREHLRRDFIGVVDTMQFTGSGQGGATIKIEARDRMKWLMDSEIYYALSDTVTNQNQELNRSSILIDIAKRSVGDFGASGGEACSLGGGCGVTFKNPKENGNDEFLRDVATEVRPGPNGESIMGELPPADAWYQPDKPLSGNYIGQQKIPKNPEFRIITSRDVGDTEEQGQFLINQQYPMEMIRFMSFQEVYPTDLFMNHKDGHIYYAPRAVDSSAFPSKISNGDSDRFYRTYYYKKFPNQFGIDVNQRCINFREERASIATYTNFIVQNSSTTGDGGVEHLFHLQALPYEFANKEFACKFKKILDPTIRNENQAAIVALSAARRWAKETRVGMMTLIGDPTLTPGEAVQVFGSPFVKNGGFDADDADPGKEDREKFFQWKTGEGVQANGGYDGLLNEYVEFSQDDLIGGLEEGETKEVKLPGSSGADGKAVFRKPKKNEVSSYLCESISTIEHNQGGEKLNTFEQQPQTIYRVEAVVQKYQLGGKGFTTEVALVSAF